VELSSDVEMRRLSREAREFFDKVLYDEECVFVSDEATVWDVSMLSAEELLERCSKYYGKPVSRQDLNWPLWRLLRKLNEGRQEAAPSFRP
jgi:hypothetical protein